MSAERHQRLVHLFFLIGVIGKAIDSALEILGGMLLLLVTPDVLSNVVRALTQQELSEDPNDLIATTLRHAAQHLSLGPRLFGAVYLLSHGLIKLGLVLGLLKRRAWVYPAAILVFLLFIAYQLYRWSYTRSMGLLGLTGLDLLVIVLTWLEYRRLRASHQLV